MIVIDYDNNSWKGEIFEDFVQAHIRGNSIALYDKMPTAGLDNKFSTIISRELTNQNRYINKYFESVNNVLEHDGVFICRAQLLEQTKKRILSKYPKLINQVFYFIYCCAHRFAPKMRFIKKLYFSITKGRYRAISKMELIGRLYSCGFELISVEIIGKDYWFATRKKKAPEFNLNASYSPFIQLKRRGLNNEFINVYKVRTMYPFSEYLQGYIYENYGLDSGGKFKNDPRVTTLGGFLRRYWLDELPMIWNIIKGDMKLVGVRPLSEHYFSLYPKKLQEIRGKVRPGLLPPYYADLPKSFDELCASEEKYIKSYQRSPLKTDCIYFGRILKNILVKRARSN